MRPSTTRSSSCARLNDSGLLTNTTLLGEGVTTEAETAAVVAAYRELLDRIAAEGLRTNVALKLTHLGLAFDEELAHAEHRGARRARRRRLGNFVRIDMEESTFVDADAPHLPPLREEGHDNVGTVLQSYLYRSEDDLEALLPLAPNLRFVKGAYLEPPEVAYREKSDVDAAYVRLLERSLTAGGFTAIATHDEALIEHAIAFAQEQRHPAASGSSSRCSTASGPKLQLDLVRRGYDVLVATPYGPDWYRYLMRRLAERPGERALPPAQPHPRLKPSEHRGERHEREVAREEVPRPRRLVAGRELSSSGPGTTSASGRAQAGEARRPRSRAVRSQRDERDEPDQVLRGEHLVEGDEHGDDRRSRHERGLVLPAHGSGRRRSRCRRC